MSTLRYILFALGYVAVIYVLNCLIALEFKRINLKQALLYVTTVGMIGVFGEIFLDTTYKWIVGHPLWRYQLLPIRHAYTSKYALVVWGIYGFHLYLLHGSLHAKWAINKTRHLALIFCFEALILEAILTLSARPVFGKYLYYYFPSDLWHVSSFQNIPFYFICAVLILKTLKRFKHDPIFFSGMSAFLACLLVFFAP
jgi:hypothetical protein